MEARNATVYLVTSVIGYLAARGSRDLVMMAHQQITREWWQEQRGFYDLFVSDLVFREAKRGDPEAVGRRLEFLELCGVLAEIGSASGMTVPTICTPEELLHGIEGLD